MVKRELHTFVSGLQGATHFLNEGYRELLTFHESYTLSIVVTHFRMGLHFVWVEGGRKTYLFLVATGRYTFCVELQGATHFVRWLQGSKHFYMASTWRLQFAKHCCMKATGSYKTFVLDKRELHTLV